MPYQLDPAAALRLGQAVLQQEAEALHMIADRIGDDFVEAVRILLDCRGRLVVSGVGKSGHIGRKLAATFASTGTPAFFVHAAEAAHGDLGMITSDDVVLAISYSGETNELLTIVPTLKREGARLIAMTGNPNSSLAKYADVHLNCHVEREACPLNLAPTTSTTATLALGDALAVSCLSAKGFSKEDFARSHPGGALGRRLLLHVSDVMRSALLCGAHGIVIPKRGGASVTPTVIKSSAGAAERLPVARVANIGETIRRLKEQGVFVYCADMDGVSLRKNNLTGPIALVLGSEGSGVSQLVKKLCDGVVSLDMTAQGTGVDSFNVSVAAGIILYEIQSQRAAQG